MMQRILHYAGIGLLGALMLLLLPLLLSNYKADAQVIYRPVGPEFDGSNLYYMILARALIGHTHDASSITGGVIDVSVYDAYSNLVYRGNIGTNGTQVAAGDHTHDLGDLLGTLDAARYVAYDSLELWDDIGDGSNQVAAGDHIHADYAGALNSLSNDFIAVSNMVVAESNRAEAAESVLNSFIVAHIGSNAAQHAALSNLIIELQGRTDVWNTVTGKVDNSTYTTEVAIIHGRIDSNTNEIANLWYYSGVLSNRVDVLETNTAPLQSFLGLSNRFDIVETNYAQLPDFLSVSNDFAVVKTNCVALPDYTAHTNNESADIQHLTGAEKLLATNAIQGATIVTGETASVETNAGILAFTVPSGGAGTITNILSTDGSVDIADPGGPQPNFSVTNYAYPRSNPSNYLTSVPYGISSATAYRGDWGAALSNTLFNGRLLPGVYDVMVGTNAFSVDGGVAIGRNANASASRGICIGYDAYCVADGVAIGYQVSNTVAGTTMLKGTLNMAGNDITNGGTMTTTNINLAGGTLNGGGGVLTNFQYSAWQLRVGSDSNFPSTVQCVVPYSTVIESNNVTFSSYRATPLAAGLYAIGAAAFFKGAFAEDAPAIIRIRRSGTEYEKVSQSSQSVGGGEYTARATTMMRLDGSQYVDVTVQQYSSTQVTNDNQTTTTFWGYRVGN